MRPKLSLLIIICMLCRYNAFSQDIHFSIVESPKDQPWTNIAGMTQDPLGYLWLATTNGLYKYDSHHYTIYRNEPSNRNSLGSNRVECVFADQDGTIWIGTYGAGLDRLDPATNTFTHFPHKKDDPGSLTNENVSAVIRDREGILWVGTLNGLDKFDPKTGKFKHFSHNDRDPNSLSYNEVRTIYEDRQGTIWVGTGGTFGGTTKNVGGLNRLNKKTDRFIRYLHDEKNPHSLIDSRVRAIFEDSRGVFWVGTAGDGLHTMDRKKGTFERHLYDPAHPEKLSRPALKRTLLYADDHIVFINEDNSGKIWIGTFQNGINVYDPLTKKASWYGHDPKNKGKILQNEFWNAYKTRDGIIWVTPWQGNELYKANPYQSGLPYNHIGKVVSAFTEDIASTLWMTTYNGLVHKDSNNVLQTFFIDKDANSTKNTMYYVERDNENKLWLTNRQGLYRFDPVSKTFIGYHHQTGNANSLNSDFVLSVKRGTTGKLWVGTNKGLDLMDIKTGTFKHFMNNIKDTLSVSGIAGTSNNSIRYIETDKNNVVWLGTQSGIRKLDVKSGNFKRYLNHVIILCLLNDTRNNLWAATDYGLFKYDKNTDKFSSLNIEATVYWVTVDHEKNLWLNTSLGILKLNLQNNKTNIYGIRQGVNVTAMKNPGYTRHNGEVLFADSSGYFGFYPDKLLHRTLPPNTIIDRFSLADLPVIPTDGGVLTKAVPNTKEIRLKHDQATFSFGFNNIDYVNVEGGIPSFYMLENYDNKWREASSDETANYYNVPPGKYIFKVKSINTDGLVTEKHIAVIISPPWWQTWWAITIFVLLFAGITWAFTYYRSLSLLKEKRVLEHKVQARTEEVLQQKEEILQQKAEIESQRDNLEIQRDDLENTLINLKTAQTQLIQSEKMASLGELTAGIAHEIQNPLNFVNNFSDVSIELLDEMEEELNKGDKDEAMAIAGDIRQNLEKINHHGKRADGIVKGMLQHSKSSTGIRELTDINPLADEYMRLAYHGLRAKDKTFSAEMVVNLDSELPKVNVVPQDIGRMMLNLFNNAFYAVNQKKKIAGIDYKPEVAVTTTSANGQVIIKVKDNGIGIPDAIKEKIMQPFFTTKPTGEGTGLGLSLTYDMVVKGYGGNIAVDSKEGGFTEFIVKLPLN